jgi:phosphomannomutase/phosphoglucomutase
MNKTGHAFMKERMRSEDAVYGGEMSGPPLLPRVRLLRQRHDALVAGRRAPVPHAANRHLAALVDARMQAFPCSGEINFRVDDAPAKIREILDRLRRPATGIWTKPMGSAWNLPTGAFNLRCSNTEPLLRLNVETRGDAGCWNVGSVSCKH